MGKARQHYAPSKKLSFFQGLLLGLQGEIKKEEEKEAAKQELFAAMTKLRFQRETELEKVGITARGGIEQAKIGAESRLGVAGISAEAGVTQAGIAARGGIEEAYTSALAGLRGREITGEYALKEREMMTGASMEELLASITSGEKMATEGREATTEDWIRRLASGEKVSEADRVSREQIAVQDRVVDVQIASMQDSMAKYRADLTAKVAADRIQADKNMQKDIQAFEREMEEFKVENRLNPEDEITAKLYTSTMSTLVNLAYATATTEDKEAQANLANLVTVFATINAAAGTALADKYNMNIPIIGAKLEETSGFFGIGKRTLPVLEITGQGEGAIRSENEWKINEAERKAAGTPLTNTDKADLKEIWGLNDTEIEEVDRRIKGE